MIVNVIILLGLTIIERGQTPYDSVIIWSFLYEDCYKLYPTFLEVSIKVAYKNHTLI